MRYTSMKKISLIRFSFDRKALGLSVAETNKFYRKLYGYHSSSNYGRYHHWIDGFINEVDGKKIATSMIIVPKKNRNNLCKYLEENRAVVQIVVDEMLIEELVFETIVSMGKEGFSK